jgi:hypothetical protein
MIAPIQYSFILPWETIMRSLILVAAAAAAFGSTPAPEWEKTDEVALVRVACDGDRIAAMAIVVAPGAQGLYTFNLPPDLCKDKP